MTGNWITFNGGVFNFRDLQSDLAKRGMQFRSSSDTEVLLKGYGLRGRKAIDSWRGMFALGIWEQGPRRLTLVRTVWGSNRSTTTLTGKVSSLPQSANT
jgi:asparagine synthase (glutamine-hydrolysing)